MENKKCLKPPTRNGTSSALFLDSSLSREKNFPLAALAALAWTIARTLQPYTMLHISGACEGHEGIRKYPIPHSPTMWFVPMAMKNVGKIMGK